MKYILLLTFLSFFLPGTTSAQSDSASLEDLPVNLLSADLKTKKAVIDLDNTEEKEFALKKIHTFKYLESLTIEGYSDDNTLQKLLYRISALRNLSEITLSENDLEKVPDNISALKYLQSLKIEGNINLDYQDLFNQIKNLQIIQLKLSDNDLKKIPTSISEIKSLRTVEITGSNRLDYEDLVSQLTRLPYLRTLAIPVNYITELPKNIDQLKSLQILDVSNNNLTELPAEVSGLKSINRLSIQGNLLLNPTAELSKLKGTNIQFLSLDKEIAAEELENIKRIFPDVEIDFPVQNLTKGPSDPNDLYGEDPALPSPKQRTGELKTKKESRILSGAYLYYPTLFRGLIYNFDTLTFEERYANTGYENVYRILDANPWRSAGVYFRKWLIGAETPGKRHETWFRLGNDAMVNNNYPELRAFSGMYWVYQGPLTKKQFTKKFIRGKGLAKRFKRKRSFVWNDIRIRFEKNNSLFTFQMKNDTGFLEFNAYPVFPDYPLDKIRQTYYKRYSLYQKTLFNRSQRFARSYRRNRNNYESSYRRLKSLAWKELQTRMSDEEKLMSQDEWLEYFDATVAN
ncbi:MAG: leucine-rich repeat domain-containing protein, partial [Bacteroidia bacterium]|nr:leucine-rich repeat domain-containing protein [Bacteroidia bacterium]